MELLLDAKVQVDPARATELAQTRRDLIDARFHAIVEQGLAQPDNAPPTGKKRVQSIPKNLLDRLRLYQS